MKYYISADIHGFFTLFREALEEKGFFSDEEDHKLILLGDLFDRGTEAKELQEFVLELMAKKQVILIRGNHEDLFETLVTTDEGVPYDEHLQNGTYLTALLLTDFTPEEALSDNQSFAAAARETPFYRRIIPAMLDYYETKHYIFTHGWIPCVHDYGGLVYYEDWRFAGTESWSKARWYNGIEAEVTFAEHKIVVCGHTSAAYGHAKYKDKGEEPGPDADYSPYYGEHMICLDAHTAVSNRVNVIVLEDE